MSCLLHNNLYGLCLLLHLVIGARAQEVSFVELKSDPKFGITEEGPQHIKLIFQIQEGYHIQAREVADENLIPTALWIEDSDDLEFGEPVFPKPVQFRLKGVKETWQVYGDVLEIEVPLRSLSPVEKETLALKGRLHYQACDDSKCYFPRDLNFDIKIHLEK